MRAAVSMLMCVVACATVAWAVPPEPSGLRITESTRGQSKKPVRPPEICACSTAIEIDLSDPVQRALHGLDGRRYDLGPFTYETLMDNGPVENRVDIVFVGDGYAAADMTTWASHTNDVIVPFFNEPPFDTYAPFFNVHRVNVISNESGVDHISSGIYRDTALDMYYPSGSRCIHVNITKAREAAAFAPDCDQILAAANDSQWGGCGYYHQDLGTFPGAHGLSEQVAMHEFGHSFGNLADEYVEYSGSTYTGGEPWQANVSTYTAAEMLALQVKWYRWLDESNVDTYEGAYYYSYGVYRPTSTSKMRSSGSPYYQVNTEQLIRLIYTTCSPIDDATPQSADVLLAGSSFYVTPVSPLSHSQSIQWFVDGNPVTGATDETFTPDYQNLADGIHTVSVEVVDNTELVRDENIRSELMTATRSWQVQGSWPGNPTGLIASATMTCVQVDWDDNPESDLLGYRVYRAETAGGPYTEVGTPATSDFEDASVVAATTYYYVVTAHTATNESGYSNEDFGTPGVNPPVAPDGLEAATADTLVHLDWDANPEPNIAGYKVLRATASGGPYTQIHTGLITPTEYDDTDVVNFTTYYYVIVARDTGGNESAASGELAATPVDLPPAAPTGLVATAGDGVVYLEWNENTEPDFREYRIYMAEQTGGPYDEIDSDDVTEWTVYGLTNGEPYFFVVSAIDEGGYESPYSSEVAATPVNINPPDAPTGLAAVEGFESVFLDWDDNDESDFSRYVVYQSETSGGPYTNVDPTVDSEMDVVALTNGQTYYFVVTAKDTAGNESAYSVEVAATPTADPVPSAPTGLTATAGDHAIQLDWNDNPEGDIALYHVYRATTAGGPYAEWDNDDPSEYYMSNLTAGVRYYFVVTAEDIAGQESDYSNEATAIPYDLDPPPAPTGLVGYPMDGAGFIEWGTVDVDDFNGYVIYEAFSPGGPYDEVDSDDVTEWLLSWLTNGQTYYYVVTAMDDYGNESGYSNEVSITPSADAPPLPPIGVDATGELGQIYLEYYARFQGTDHFNIYRSTVSGGAYTLIDSTPSEEYEDFSAADGATYYYVVTGVDASGHESVYSAEVAAAAITPLPPPYDVYAVAYTSSVRISWTMPSDQRIDGFGIYRSSTSGGPYSQTGAVQDTMWTDYDVVAGTTYYYVVVSIQNQTESDYSEEVFATPGGCTSDAQCDDGLYCNGGETCSAGTCLAGTAINCDDAIPCTVDSCNESTDTCDNTLNHAYCDDGLYCNGLEVCDAVSDCLAGTDPCPGEICNETTDTCEPIGQLEKLEADTVLVGGNPVTVTLANTYDSPVVVCSIQYDSNTTPVVARLTNVTSTSFDVYLQNPSDGAVATEVVNYIVVEEGTWTIDGVKIEAQTYLSTRTDENNSWVGTTQSYGQSYSQPVVLGQVMTSNDSDWSVFWCRGNRRTNPPSSTSLRTGKTVCEDSRTSRNDEVVGFIVFEAGYGTIGGVDFVADLGSDEVRGVTNRPPYTYGFAARFASAPDVAVVTQAAMDGGDGSWAYTYGSSPTGTSELDVVVDEDQIKDSDRNHTTEQVGYVVFETSVVFP